VRLLLDECVDRRLARDIVGHEVSTVGDLGWAGVKNGALLARAAGQFDVFVTVDRNLSFSSGSKVCRLLSSSSTRDRIACSIYSLSFIRFSAYFQLCSLAKSRGSRPNPSVNSDAPVRVFLLASACGGEPVT
jgi:hypothetical protein